MIISQETRNRRILLYFIFIKFYFIIKKHISEYGNHKNLT